MPCSEAKSKHAERLQLSFRVTNTLIITLEMLSLTLSISEHDYVL